MSHEDYDGEDLRNPHGHPPDKDPHPDVPDRDPNEEPPGKGEHKHDHPDHLTGKPDDSPDAEG